MNPKRYFIPTYPYTMPLKNPSLFSRIFGGFRGINWSSLLTNANKTLNVVNQTIPLIRQTGPMFNNLRSMVQLTRAFNSETITKKNHQNPPPKKQNYPSNQSSPKKTIESIPPDTPQFFI